MKLASFADSERGKRLKQLLIVKGHLWGYVDITEIHFLGDITQLYRPAMFVVGVVAFTCLPLEGICRQRFFDENALLTGLVKRQFNDGPSLKQLLTQYNNIRCVN